jgi:hypothetical protein
VGTKRKTKITVETDEVLIIRSSRTEVTAWCAGCNQHVRMVTTEQAASTAGRSLRWVLRQVEAGRLHFLETPEGGVLICPNSLNEST